MDREVGCLTDQELSVISDREVLDGVVAFANALAEPAIALPGPK